MHVVVGNEFHTGIRARRLRSIQVDLFWIQHCEDFDPLFELDRVDEAEIATDDRGLDRKIFQRARA